MHLLFALMSALAWGLQGFLLKFISKKTNTISTMTTSYVIGTVVLLPLVWSKLPQLTLLDLRFGLFIIIAIAANTLGAFSYYRAVEHGNVAIVVPVVSCSGAVTLVLSLFSGEQLSVWQMLVIVVIIIGIILSARQPTQHQKKNSGIAYAITATLSYGLGVWIIGSQLRSYLQGDILSWLLLTLQLIIVGGFQLIRSIPFPLQGLGLVSLTGFMGVLGYITLTIALGNQQNGMVAVIGSLYGLVSVVLAWFFLKEHLLQIQWIGVGCALLGVIAIGLIR